MQDGHRGFARYPSLEERAVLVTGGATGIGASVVEHFARQGSRVAFLDVQHEAGERLAEDLASEGFPRPLFLACDLTDLTSLASSVAEVIRRLGTVDVLVNNAANDQRHTIEEVTEQSWDRSMAVNLRPQFFAIQAVAGNAGKGARIDHQYVFDCVDDSLNRARALHCGQGGDCRTHPHPCP